MGVALAATSRIARSFTLRAFRQGLKDAGFIEGENVPEANKK